MNSPTSLPVSLTYAPAPIVQPVPGAEAVHVEVMVQDLRQDKSTLGDVKTAFQEVPIATDDEPSQLLKSAVESELRDRGFELGTGDISVMIDLEGVAVEDHRSVSLYSIDSTNEVRAIVIIGVQVKSHAAAVLYSKIVNGKVAFGSNGTGSSASQRALDYAFDEAVKNLMRDPEFIKALLATRKTVKPAATAPPHAAPKPAPPNKR